MPRTPKLDLPRVPKTWLLDSRAASHFANGVNLLFPAGERMFVRSIRAFEDQLADPELRARVRGMYAQEGRHAQAHERAIGVLREQGYPVDEFLSWYEKLAYGVVERASPRLLRLSVTAAAEHLTAIMAEDALTGGVLRFAHPEMRRLLEWHAVEELEHKSVAFDVLAAVNPSWFVRASGMALGSALLAMFWAAGTKRLLDADGLTLGDLRSDLARLRAKARKRGATGPQGVARRVFLRGLREYLRPGFHPDQRDHGPLVAETLARLEAEGVLAA